MGGNERKDQLLQTYLIERKKMNKYYMKMINRLLNVTVLNEMAIYRKIWDRTVDCLKFRVGMVQSLIVKYSKERKVTGLHADKTTVARLTKQHFPRRILEQKGNKNPQSGMLCEERQETRCLCPSYELPLCVDKCFMVYHAKKNF